MANIVLLSRATATKSDNVVKQQGHGMLCDGFEWKTRSR
jgi:hypothetical protein